MSEGVMVALVTVVSYCRAEPQRVSRFLRQRRNDKRIALTQIVPQILIAERAIVDALHPGQSARREIGGGAQPRKLAQDCKARLGAFEGHGEFGRKRPSADSEDLSTNFPYACVAPLNGVGRMRKTGAKGVILFASHHRALRIGGWNGERERRRSSSKA
jgi:hypothetical protein